MTPSYLSCPRCRYSFSVAVPPGGAWLTCATCHHFFHQAGRAVAEDTAVLLTGPHLCQHLGCEGQLRVATGRNATTLYCPLCRRPTSAYAVLYRCGNPSCRRRLETPRTVYGEMPERAVCPACHVGHDVPHDLLRRRGERKEPDTYCFPCPACAAPLETETPHAGRLAACPACRDAVRVPGHGTRLGVVRAGPSGPAEVLGQADWRRCPGCFAVIPQRSATCPKCGRPAS